MATELGDWLIVAFTFVVAVSTGFYAFLTWKLVTETRRMREAQTEPRVSVRVEQQGNRHLTFELTISNEGQGLARNVRFEFEGDPTYFRYSTSRRAPPQVDELTAIKDGLDYLETSQVYRYPIGIVFPEEFERAAKTPWIFRIHYENLQGEQRTRTNTIDFSQFRGMSSEPDYLEEIADYLNYIQQDLHPLAQGYTNLRVVTQAQEQLEQRREQARQAAKDQTSSDHDVPVAESDVE